MPAHKPHCSKALEGHVVYDKHYPGYRAQIRCACGAVQHVSVVCHPTWAPADRESRTMRVPQQFTQRLRFPLSAPTDAEIRSAWLKLWHRVCAKAGYISRLRG